MSADRFSDRFGLRPEEPLIYDTAPDGLRYGLREVLHGLEYKTPGQQRYLLCKAFRIPPDQSNWSDSIVDWEVTDLLAIKPWYRFFDAVERIPRFLADEWVRDYFVDMNRLFAEERIGYRFVAGILQRVGTDEFHDAIAVARGALQGERLSEPRRQFERACEFRNELPPDWSNAIKEAVNSVEAVMQVIYNRPGVSLTTIVSDNLPDDVPSGIKQLLRTLYSQGSGTTGARHASVEGIEPTGPRAELAIHVAAALHAYVVSELDVG